MDWMKWVLSALLAIFILLLATVGVAVWQDSNLPTFELKKDDWECVEEERRTHLQSMLVGKIMIMQPITNTVCLEYRRIGG